VSCVEKVEEYDLSGFIITVSFNPFDPYEGTATVCIYSNAHLYLDPYEGTEKAGISLITLTRL
jgi:hypothetical protein